MFQNIAVAALATVGLVLTGCGSGTTATKQSAGPASAPTSAASSSAPASTEPPAVEETTPTPTPDEPGIAKIGPTQWFTYEDGLKVQVTKLARKKIGQYASGGQPGGTAVVVTVTIKNGSGKAFDSSLADVKVSHGPNGDEAEQVFDTGIEEFSGTIPNGRVRTAQYEFAVPKAHYGQVLVEVAPSWEHDASHFEGVAK